MPNRTERLLPGGVPKWIRSYDSGPDSGFDRYTVVYTGKRDRSYHYVGMSEHPFWPGGFGQHGEGKNGPIDRPTYGHLGKRVSFGELPPDCQKLVLQDYQYLWDLPNRILGATIGNSSV